MIPSLVALAAVTIACALIAHECFKLVTLERRHMAEERSSWGAERAILLQRIQAPEQAVVDHSVRVIPHTPVAPVPMDNDAAHWAGLGEKTKDELADLAYAAELA